MGRGAPLVQTWCATPVGQMLFCINNCDFEIETTSQRPPQGRSQEIQKAPFLNLKRIVRRSLEFRGTGVARKSGPGGPPAHHALNRPQLFRSQGFTSRPRNIAKREFKNQNPPGASNNSQRPLFRRERPHPPQRKAPSALRAPWGLALAASALGARVAIPRPRDLATSQSKSSRTRIPRGPQTTLKSRITGGLSVSLK